MSFADEIYKDVTLPTGSISFDFFISRIVFYTAAATILIGCICLCTLLIKKVVRSFKKAN